MNRNLRSGQTGRVPYQFAEVIKQGIVKRGSVGDAADLSLAALNCIPLQDIPSVFESEMIFSLPLSDQQFDTFFGQAVINPLGITQASAAAGIIEATSDIGPTNSLSADFCLMGIGVTIEGDTENLVVPGVLGADDADAVTAACDYSAADLDTSLPAFNGLIPAVMNHGTYSRQAAEHLADALQFTFTIAERLVVIDEGLDTLASCGTRQGGMGFSRSEMDTPYYVARMNAAQLGTGANNLFAGKQFYPVNSRRTGQDGGLSTYAPDACAGRIANVSLNVGLRHSLYTNDCTRIFDKPILLKAGRPIQLGLSVRSKVYATLAKAAMTQSFGGLQSADGFTGPGPSFNECAGCDTPALASFSTNGNVAVLKDGALKIKVCLLGVLLYEQALCDAFNAVCDKYGDACMLRP